MITIRCVYDGGFEAFGNGKLEKQAKLVAAWNMIERLKKENIGIVNETLATGIVVDKSVLKKPVIFSNFCQVGLTPYFQVAGQFTSFKKAGTLSSSFVSASSSSSTPAKLETAVVVESVAERLAKEAQREVDEYQRSLLEGDKQSEVINGPVKRSHDDMAGSERLHNPKVAKTSGDAGSSQPVIGTVTSPANSIGPQVIPKVPQPEATPESSSVPQFGYDWSRAAHRGSHPGRGGGRRGSSGAGTRPGDWPCTGVDYSFFLLMKIFFLSLWKLQLRMAVRLQPVRQP